MKTKKILSLLVAMVMTLSCVGITAMAETVNTLDEFLNAIENGDGNITLGADIDLNGNSYVAKIGKQGYETVEAAINAAQNGDTVTICAGEYGAINISDKNITIQGTVGDNGELLTTIKDGNPAITGHSFNGTIRDIKIVDAWKVMYAEPAGNVTVDNVYVTGATYGFHLVAYSPDLTWKIENSYMDLRWANSFGVDGAGDADIIIRDNEFAATNPYYEGGDVYPVNSYLPSVTVEENIFGENTRISIENVTDTSKINISKNYHADGVENAFDSGSVTVPIKSYYTDVDADGNLTGLVTITDDVAEVNGVKYATLAEAVANAKAGETITLLENIELTETVTVPAGKTVTLDLNGKTVSGNANSGEDSLLFVSNTAKLTVKDSGTGGKLTIAPGTSNVGYVVDLEGKLILESGTIEMTGEWSIGYGVDVRPNAWGTPYTEETTFTMNGGKIVSSDGAVRVASSSADSYNNIVASFTMNGGEIDADWDGVFVQQSNAAWDVLKVTINDGTIKSDLNPIRFYGPAATSYVNGEDCVNIALNGGTLTYTGEKAQEWLVDKILRLGGGVAAEDFLKDTTVTASASFAASNVAEGYEWVKSNGTYTLGKAPELPTATVTELSEEELGENAPELTFALNFKADEVTKEQLDYYGDWFADYVLTINKDFTANADGSADGYLAGQYDTYSENWVSVPFENVTLEAGTKLRVLKYALEGKLTDYKTPLTYKDVYNLVKEFNCGIYFDEDYIAANPDLKVTLELRMYHPDESKNKTYVIGRTYEFAASDIATPVAEVNGVGYSTLQAALDAAAAGTGNVTVEILDNINLAGVDWNPVTVSAPGYPVVTVNGNGKTITGLNDMLFAGTWAGGSGLIINDLTIADSNIVNDKDDAKGNVGVGAFIGYPQASATITLNNCHLVNSTVEGGHWTGGLIGIAGGYSGDDGPVFMNLTIENCSVTGSTITGKGSAGGISGHAANDAWTNVVITDTTVSGNTITSTGSSNNKAGAVMGTIGAAGQSATANGNTKTGGVSVSATVSGNTVTSNGTPITTIYGRQGSTTGMLYVTGGTYDNNPIEENVAYAQPKEGYEIVQNEDKTWGVQEKAPEVELFDFYGSAPVLENSLAMQFAIAKTHIKGTDYYAEIDHYKESGKKTTTIPFENWLAEDEIYIVEYPGIFAKEIGDIIEVAIYDGTGNRVSVKRVDGLKEYAIRMLSNSDSSTNLKTALVDMLNYGTAAQIEFNYKVNTLANNGIDNYKQYASTTLPTLENKREMDSTVCYGTTLELEENIELLAAFKGITEGMSATISFTDHYGNKKYKTVSFDEMEQSNGFQIITVDNLVVADADVLVTITVYNTNGTVYTTFKDSINGYLARNIDRDADSKIYETIAKFTASAHKALH